MQILCFDQKIKNNLKKFFDCNITSLSIESTTFVSPNGRLYHCAAGVLSAWLCFRNFVINRGDWLSIKFCENDSFRKLFLFFENSFQYLGGISQDISVSYFDSHRSLSSANRRRIVGDLPRRFFLSALLSLVISMTGRSEQSTRALRDGSDVVREAIGNWFWVRICYMFLLSKCRRDWDLGLCATSVLALGEQMRDGKIQKQNVFRRRKNRILPLHFGSPNASTELCTDLDLSLLYILILGTYSKFARKINFLALGVYCLAGQSAFRRSRP